MAAIQMRQYGLTVLKVTLVPGRSSTRRIDPEQAGGSMESYQQTSFEQSSSIQSAARVQFELQERGQDDVKRFKELEIPARDLGIPRHLQWECLRGRGGYSFKLPPAFDEWLQNCIRDFQLADTVLWLHLVKPYGYLGMFPWERELKERINSPVLRLPDFLIDPPKQTQSSLDIALLCTLGPGDKDQTTALLLKIAAALGESGGTRPANVTVFADRTVCAKLSESGPAKSPERFSFQAISLHADTSLLTTHVLKPIAAASEAISNPIREWLRGSSRTKAPRLPTSSELIKSANDPIKSPWLRAVRSALGGRSVDVVHVISHAALSLERGTLLLDQADPTTQAPGSHAVPAAEFLVFQAQVGAWAIGVTSVPDSYSDMALRQFADELAQLRPGPLLYHDAFDDPAGCELRKAYTLLLSDRPSAVPKLLSVFAYCEPFRVHHASQPEATLEGLSELYSNKEVLPQRNESVESIFRQMGNVPSWFAASERFVDIYKLRLTELASKEIEPTDQIDEIKSTLARLQDAIAKVAKDRIS